MSVDPSRQQEENGESDDAVDHAAPFGVRNYLAAAMTKLGVPTRAEAVRIAHEHGWL
ncbi:response regulator transcription factor [Acrocarpospora phusangensis]|nr:response regulator transcription factor [Acrocarpospora phusangensis]